MAAKKQKNRRYWNAKISEHRLRRVVECFARDMTAAETVKATKLSAPTVNLIFQRLRERLRDYGLFVPKFDDGAPHPLPAVFNPKHRSVPEHQHDLHAIERIHRILCAQHLKGFERLPAPDPKNVEKAARLLRFDEGTSVKRYQIWEAIRKSQSEIDTPQSRPFDATQLQRDSEIIINELHICPQDVFFAYLWAFLLSNPIWF